MAEMNVRDADPVRRRLLGGGLMGFAAWHFPLGLRAAEDGVEARKPLRLALISDVHQDVMHDGPARLEVFLAKAREWKVDGIMEMGDFCTPKPENRAFADLFEGFEGPKFHIIGNHEMDGGFKREQVVEYHKMPGRYYSFDLGGIHGVVLDGNDVPAGHKGGYPSFIADDQIAWLEADLAKTELPVFVFSHQSLERPTCIGSQEKVRGVIEAAKRGDGSRKVAACLNGHFHLDHAREIGGIPYIHINSASYYWVGGDFKRKRYAEEVHAKHPSIENTAPYRDAVFTLLEVDFAKGRFTLAGMKSEWVGPSPQEMGQGYPGIDPGWVVPGQSAREGVVG